MNFLLNVILCGQHLQEMDSITYKILRIYD